MWKMGDAEQFKWLDEQIGGNVEGYKMMIQDNTIIQPIPTNELLAEKERKWRLVLPVDYKNFIVNYIWWDAK